MALSQIDTWDISNVFTESFFPPLFLPPIYCKSSQNLFSLGLLLPRPGSCGAWYRWPLLPHSGLMGSIRPLQSVWALQRSKRGRKRGGARGEAMVVELLLSVWRLAPTLAAAKCLDTSQDSDDPRLPLVIMDCCTCMTAACVPIKVLQPIHFECFIKGCEKNALFFSTMHHTTLFWEFLHVKAKKK